MLIVISKQLIIILKISFVCYSFSGTELRPFLKKIKADHNDWHTGRNLSCPHPHKTM